MTRPGPLGDGCTPCNARCQIKHRVRHIYRIRQYSHLHRAPCRHQNRAGTELYKCHRKHTLQAPALVSRLPLHPLRPFPCIPWAPAPPLPLHTPCLCTPTASIPPSLEPMRSPAPVQSAGAAACAAHLNCVIGGGIAPQQVHQHRPAILHGHWPGDAGDLLNLQAEKRGNGLEAAEK